MAKSLTETAKAILSNEQVIVNESNDGTPDRDAKKTTPNSATLKPKSKTSEGRFANPGANSTGEGEYQDLGPAVTKQGDVPGSAKASGAVSKDTSGSSQSRKGAVPAETRKSQAAIQEDEAVADEVLDEEIEITEELQEFIEKCLAEGMDEDQIALAIEENFDIISEDENLEVNEETDEKVQIDVTAIQEHVDALLAGEELSEEFKEKAQTIFEAAVSERVNAELQKIQEAYAETLDEQISQIRESLVTDVDDYLTYVVEQWSADNEVAIEAGLRTELTEDFITGLKNLFAENYLEIPEDKVSVVEELTAKVNELTEKLNEEIDHNVALTKMVSESKRDGIVSEAVEGLTDTEAEKLKVLSENLEYTSPDEFSKKIEVLKESYFKSVPATNQPLDRAESTGNGMIVEDSRMEAYARVLGRKLPT